jgi:hypothetical protein
MRFGASALLFCDFVQVVLGPWQFGSALLLALLCYCQIPVRLALAAFHGLLFLLLCLFPRLTLGCNFAPP